jgi:DNA modification methylase
MKPSTLPRLPLEYAGGPKARLLLGDCREVLAELPAQSVHCVITSPPYFGLRDYGTGEWEGGEPGCDHVEQVQNLNVGFNERWGNAPGEKKQENTRVTQFRDLCGHCGARRVDRQIGLEGSLAEYLETMVGVFRQVWRVLRDDGTLFLNMGDSYAGYWGDKNARMKGEPPASDTNGWTNGFSQNRRPEFHAAFDGTGLKPKDLMGVPWRLAFALQAEGWYLRSDIIYSKPNPMPESVTDRPTRSHEYLFLLAKRPTYFYDAEAIREDSEGTSGFARQRQKGIANWSKATQADNGRGSFGLVTGNEGENRLWLDTGRRNRRTVWEITPQPFPEGHFAVFPEALVEPCLLAGTSARGVCPACGAGWVRVVEKGELRREDGKPLRDLVTPVKRDDSLSAWSRPGGKVETVYPNTYRERQEVGWQPTCTCNAGDPIPATALDPFGGAGTVALVALKHNRSAVSIELNPEYLAITRRRLAAWSDCLE